MALDLEQLDKLKNLLSIVDESITRDEFVKAFENVLTHVVLAEKKSLERVDSFVTKALDQIRESFKTYKDSSSRDFKTFSSEFDSLKKEIVLLSERMFKEQHDGMNFMRDSLRRVQNGKDGKNGKDGRDGKDGKDGASGRDGKDGAGGGGTSTIGIQQVLTKIMKHQKFSTSSATTTSTLTNKVAGNVCIWLRYNGQMLHYGDQYTISGTTISYTFTLDDSSVVEATYITG